jgi:hypothetical protein
VSFRGKAWQNVAKLTAGATNYMGKLAFMGEGQGDNIAPAIYVMEPTPPYNTTGKLAPIVEADNSDPEQLLWTAIQLAQRRRYPSPE